MLCHMVKLCRCTSTLYYEVALSHELLMEMRLHVTWLWRCTPDDMAIQMHLQQSTSIVVYNHVTLMNVHMTLAWRVSLLLSFKWTWVCRCLLSPH